MAPAPNVTVWVANAVSQRQWSAPDPQPDGSSRRRLQAMALESSKRFQSAAEFAAALEPLCRQPAESPLAEPDAANRRRRMWVTFCLVAVVIIGGAFATRFVGDRDQITMEPTPTVADGFSQRAKLSVTDAVPDDRFGVVVAVSGDTLVVGAHQVDRRGQQAGAAYVLMRRGDHWVQDALLSGEMPGDQFGGAVAISRDTIVVGAHLNDGSKYDSQHHDSGAAFVFSRRRGRQIWKCHWNRRRHGGRRRQFSLRHSSGHRCASRFQARGRRLASANQFLRRRQCGR